MRFGLDSTDARDGGCTTMTAARILAALPGYAVRTAPHLVRLNPNIPYKTRGNGALAFEIGRAAGPTHVIGRIDGHDILACDQLDPLDEPDQESAFHIATEVVRRERRPGSDTCLAAFTAPPAAQLYWEAVQRHAEPPTATAPFERRWGSGRGRLGAAAAAAWPGQTGTWEAIAYRDETRIGTPRQLDPAVGPELDAEFPATFDNWDPTHQHLRLAPASPCPILAGVRGTDPHQAMAAIQRLRPETPTGWLLFWTNQATGDHLRNATLRELRAFDAARLSVTVRATPRTMPGGHVFLDVSDETGHATAAAYEPTKEFRDAVRRLRPGDEVELEAGVHDDANLLALEAFTLKSPAPQIDLEPPACAVCAGPTKSAGRRGGYRCPNGHTTPPAHARRATSTRARYETRVTVPTIIRRHLARPNHVQPTGPYRSLVTA